MSESVWEVQSCLWRRANENFSILLDSVTGTDCNTDSEDQVMNTWTATQIVMSLLPDFTVQNIVFNVVQLSFSPAIKHSSLSNKDILYK